MKHFLRVCVVGAATLMMFVACSSESTTNTSSSGSTGGTSGGTSSGTSGGTSGGTSSSSGTSSGSSSGDPPLASTKEGDIQFNAACPTFTACPGSPSGTYDYTAGCAGDVFAQVKQSCTALDTSKAKATVKGSIYFLAAGVLKRNVSVTISGSLTVPASCAAGQCAAAETALKGSFPTAKCVAAGADCTCTISKVDTNTATTTFTVSGSTVTTGDGETYTICEQGSSLKYTGKSAGSEGGTWELTKR